MIKVDFSTQVNYWAKELEEFRGKIQNNIHIGGLRVASNVIKDELVSVPMETVGKISGEKYKKNLRKSQIRIAKRRRTKNGWERFKISFKREDGDPQERRKAWYYNVISGSKEQMRYADGNKGATMKKYTKMGGVGRNAFAKSSGFKKRGILQQDPFMQRATKKARQKALSGYVYYIRERILADGAKISANTRKYARNHGN